MMGYLGEIGIFPWQIVPEGWLPCDGRLLPVKEHQALFSLLSTRFGGDGKKDFRIPDMRGRVPVHSNGMAGSVGGVEHVTLTDATMPKHRHALVAMTSAGTSANALNAMLATTKPSELAPAPRLLYGDGKIDGTLNAATLSQTGGGGAHENMQPFLVVNYCIRIRGDYPPRAE